MLFKLLFPGVILHELAHYLACLIVGVKVYSVKLFGSREAFVQHSIPNAWQSLTITLAPFFLNNFFGLWLFFFASDMVKADSLFSLPFYWLSISMLFHSFPSQSDAMNSFNATRTACIKRLKKGSLASRLLWLFITPFLFVPVLLLTGFLLVFDKSDFLKLLWVLTAILFAFQPKAPVRAIDNIFI